jgi:hypothetical protein
MDDSVAASSSPQALEAEAVEIHREISHGLFGRPGALEQGIEIAPQRAAFLAFGRGQLSQRLRIAKPR